MTAYHADPDVIAEAIINDVGKSIILAMPLGLGKANHIANALFARATDDPSIKLRIFTALTLETPSPSSELERRFLEPAVKRLFGDYPPLSYVHALRNNSLPSNIEIDEFFFLAGRWRFVDRAQQNYISANYTDALEYILNRGVNVVAQLAARRRDGPKTIYSLSCNPDITPDLLKARSAGAANFILVGQVNSELPFMGGDAAIVGEDTFAHILDSPETDFELYSAPKRPVSFAEQAIGLHATRLVADGGTLQIGIGAVGDAVAYALILRHQKNDEFKRLMRNLDVGSATPDLFDDRVFDKGLYGCSEMLVDGFLHLENAGVLKREVDGAIVHAGFFVDCRAFYKTLREMPEERRRRFAMTAVSFTNTLYGGVEERRRARVHARFINNAMMATLLGAVISDGTEDGQVVSGVGGQLDFVQQAFALDGARSVITLNATRNSRGKIASNILWSYGHTTIPRQLRDIVVTEYGVADLRGRSDAQVIAAMLAIADSRFQQELLDLAKRAGKISKDYEIPAAFRNNTPQRISETLASARKRGLLPVFPFGADFSVDEQCLIPALNRIKDVSASRLGLAQLILRGALAGAPSASHASALSRMTLGRPTRLKDRLYRWLVYGALLESAT